MSTRTLRAAALAACLIGLSVRAADNYQGLWWNAPADSESGWGISFAHQGDVIFATWYTYDTDGKGLWFAFIANQSAEREFTGTIYQTRGPAFSAVPFDPSRVNVSSVGSGTLAFTDAGHGRFSYTVKGISQAKNITRQIFGRVPTCASGSAIPATSATNYQDLWYADPPESESGWGVSFAHQSDTLFATWYTYDTDGSPMWLVSVAPKSAEGTYTGDLFRTTGPAFSAVPFVSANVVLTKVGTLAVTFTDGNHARFQYAVNGVSQSKAITRQLFRGGTVCGFAEGVWTGTTSKGEAATALLLDGGGYYVVYSSPDTGSEAGIVQGDATMDDGALRSSDGNDYPVAAAGETADSATPVDLSGSYTASALNLGWSGRTLAMTRAPDSNMPAALDVLAGSYAGISGHAGGRQNATFTIDASGNLTGQNPACIFRATITPRAALHVYDLNLASGGTPCIFGRSAQGVLVYDATTRRLRGLAPFPGRQDLFYLLGTKQ